MNWEIVKADHIGGREEQQDSVATFSTPNGNIHLLVVADGMGGHKGGSLASQTVIKSAQSIWNKYQSSYTITTPHEFLQRICDKAHRDINQLGRKYRISPRSTCVLLYISNKRAWWAYIGDSRLYHFRGKKLLHRTKDHSVVQLLVDLGQVKEEEMANHPDQNRLLRGLGGNEPVKPDIGQASIHLGDSLILCSDGFWEYISAHKMSEQLLQTKLPIERRVKNLITETLDTSGMRGDNIAIAVAQLSGKMISRWIYMLLIIIIGVVLLSGGVWGYLKSRITLPDMIKTQPLKNTPVPITMSILSKFENRQ